MVKSLSVSLGRGVQRGMACHCFASVKWKSKLMQNQKNVLGLDLVPCSTDPLTDFFGTVAAILEETMLALIQSAL